MANLADQVLLFLVAGTRADAVETYCVGPGKQTPEQAKIIIAEARKRLTIAATFNRDEQFGKAISRLEDLYSKSITAADIRSALQRLAAQSGAALLVCHQCNRKASEEDTELKLHHLRDSGTIEQDARLVLLVTKCDRDELDSTRPAVLTLKVAKNSHGPRERECRLLAHFDRACIDNYLPAGANE